MESGGQLIKSKAFDLIRSILDCLIALYYLRDTLGPKAAGVIGVITSIMAIIQSIKLI